MKPETAWNTVSVAALAACLCALAFYLYFPTGQAHVPEPPVRASDAALARAHDAAQTAQSLMDEKEWTQDDKALSGLVLSDLSSAALKRKVQVTDLRFDRPIVVSGLKETPFTVMVEGDFKDVLDFVGGLEAPNSKLGVGMLQLSSSDQGPGNVKATIRLTAFLRGEV